MADFASAIYSSADKVWNVENDRGQYSEEQIKLAKEYLGIANMPLTESERADTKARIYYMRSLVRESKFEEAEAVYIELSNLTNLEPCDTELPMLFRLLEVHFLLFTDKLDAAEEKLHYFGPRVGSMIPRHKYYLYCNKGTLHIMRGRYLDGLEWCKEALEVSKRNNDFLPDNSEKPRLLGNIGMCYSNLHFPHKAIIYLLKARALYPEKGADRLGLALDLTLAYNYLLINALYEAKDTLDNCRMQANALKDTHYIGLTMLHFGVLHMKTRNWEMALTCLDQSIKCYEKGSAFHFAATHRKILCLIHARTFKEARKLITRAQVLYNTHEVYSKYIESTVHYLAISMRKTFSNPEAVNYIMNVTIPHYKKMCDFFEAISYYELLEENFRKTGNPTKALRMIGAIQELHQRCLLGDERSNLFSIPVNATPANPLPPNPRKSPSPIAHICSCPIEEDYPEYPCLELRL